MKMTSRWRKTRVATLVLGFGLVVGYQGCGDLNLAGNPSHEASSSSTLGSSDGSSHGSSAGDDIFSSGKAEATVGVVNSEEVLYSLVSITGLEHASSNAFNVYSTMRTQIAEEGEADSVNAPMWLAVLNISGQVCNDLVAKEAGMADSDRRIFRGVTFSAAPGTLATQTLKDIVRRFARSAWGRNETPEELAVLMESQKLFTMTTKGATAAHMTFVCSAMLSSLETHVR